MASFIYTHAKAEILKGNIDLVNDDIRVLLVMTNTTADTEKDVDDIDELTTLDEMDGANYARKALTGEAVSEDEANDRGEFDADDVTWSALGDGTRQIAAAIVYKFLTIDIDSIPIAYIDDSPYPLDPGGADHVIQWNAEGIIQAT
ncbi:MAG TPA: hypothetical protein VMW52_02870 [Phycisphaerae bacterium]|nr:hypothetical protein [Phycisphaerae bacterium]